MWWVKYQINYLRAHKELKASPLKPNVSTLVRSEKSLSFDVWCFKVKASKLCGSTPKPLSLTSKKSAPWFFSLISMFVAPASKLFSTSSFIAVAMLNTTCPEHIWWMDFWSIDWTTGDDETAAILLNIGKVRISPFEVRHLRSVPVLASAWTESEVKDGGNDRRESGTSGKIHFFGRKNMWDLETFIL